MIVQFINENKRLFVFLVISFAINIIIYLLIGYPLHSHSNEIAGKVLKLSSDNEQLTTDWISKGRTVANLESTLRILEDIEDSIPEKEGGLKDFIAQIEEWNQELNLNIIDINISYETLENKRLRISTMLKIRSNYENIKKLLYYIENYERMVAAQSLTINEFPEEGIEMQIGLIAFFYEEEAYL